MHFILYLVLVGDAYSVFYNEFWCKWIKIHIKSCGNEQKALPLHSQLRNTVGAIAQLVEQRTENPCVPGSIPGGTTTKRSYSSRSNSFLCCYGVMLLCCDLIVISPPFCCNHTITPPHHITILRLWCSCCSLLIL